MPDPLVIQSVDQYRAALLAKEAAQMDDMAYRWIQVENALGAQINALAQELANTRAAGKVVSHDDLLRMDRYQKLLAQAQDQVDAYTADYAAPLIATKQTEYAQQGLDDAAGAIGDVYKQNGILDFTFNRIDLDAVQFAAGFAGDGSPLSLLLAASYPDAVDGLTNALLTAVAIGRNPRQTAADMTDGFGIGLDRALTIARTEQLRAYRESSRAQYQQSGVVSAYRRICSRSDRTCPGCLAADGRLYALDEPFEEHPAGRCGLVPVVSGLPDDLWQTGPEWFAEQDEETQRAILGPGRYDKWSTGRVPFGAFATTVSDDTWGNAIIPTPLGSLR